MWLLIITLGAGLAYGKQSPHTTRRRLILLDLAIATTLALLIGISAHLLNTHPLGLPETTTANHTISSITIALAFITGTWISDLLLTHRTKRLSRRTT